MNKKIVLGALCVLLPRLVAAEGLFDAQEFRLDNGLRVIAIENHRAPIVKQMLWYQAGSTDERIGAGGSAHLLEHLMFRGTKLIPGQTFNTLLEKNGAESNAFTAYDNTVYHQLVDVGRLELAMFLEADRMKNLDIGETDFAAERDIVFQERKERVDNNPSGRFFEAMNRALWQEHPHARPVSGTDEEIKHLTRQDIEDFYKRFYVPNNAILVLSGDIDAVTAKELAQKYYGNLRPAGKKSIRSDFSAPPEDFKATVDMKMPQIRGNRVVKIFVAPSYQKQTEDVYSLMVWAAYLGEGETSKLYKKLVLQDKVALNVSAEYNPLSRSYGTFAISAMPAKGTTPEQLLAKIDQVWNEEMQNFDQKAAEKIKRKMLAGLVYMRDNPEDAAYIVGAMAAAGASLDEIEAYEQNIKAVKDADVRKAAQKLRAHAPQVTGILRPEENTDETNK